MCFKTIKWLLDILARIGGGPWERVKRGNKYYWVRRNPAGVITVIREAKEERK